MSGYLYKKKKKKLLLGKFCWKGLYYGMEIFLVNAQVFFTDKLSATVRKDCFRYFFSESIEQMALRRQALCCVHFAAIDHRPTPWLKKMLEGTRLPHDRAFVHPPTT